MMTNISNRSYKEDNSLLSSSSSNAAVTMSAICALGFALFLIASAIVLSLIPIYLPQHGSIFNLEDR